MHRLTEIDKLVVVLKDRGGKANVLGVLIIRDSVTVSVFVILSHFFIEVIGRLDLAPAVKLAPALILKHDPGDFYTAVTGIVGTARSGDTPAILLVIEALAVIRGEEVGIIVNETASVGVLKTVDAIDDVVPLRAIPHSPIRVCLRHEGGGGLLACTSTVGRSVFFYTWQKLLSLFEVRDNVGIVVDDRSKLLRDFVVVSTLNIFIGYERNTEILGTVAVGGEQVVLRAKEVSLT